MAEMSLRLCLFSLGWWIVAEGTRSVGLCEVGVEVLKSVIKSVMKYCEEITENDFIKLTESNTPRKTTMLETCYY